MKIVLLDEAQRRVEAEDAWWRQNRDTRDLFLDEFARTLEQIAKSPELGQYYRRSSDKTIQRVLMKKTRCHVYYHHDSQRGCVEIHSVWGARREKGPDL